MLIGIAFRDAGFAGKLPPIPLGVDMPEILWAPIRPRVTEARALRFLIRSVVDLGVGDLAPRGRAGFIAGQTLSIGTGRANVAREAGIPAAPADVVSISELPSDLGRNL